VQNAPQPCTTDTQGLLYFDLSSSKMYRCRQRQWQEWDWGHGAGTTSKGTTSTRSTSRTGSTTRSTRRQQTSVRRAASTTHSSAAESSTCPTGIPIIYNLLFNQCVDDVGLTICKGSIGVIFIFFIISLDECIVLAFSLGQFSRSALLKILGKVDVFALFQAYFLKF